MRRFDWKWWVVTAIAVVGIALSYLALPDQIDERRMDHVVAASTVFVVVLLVLLAVHVGAWRVVKQGVRTLVDGVVTAAGLVASLLQQKWRDEVVAPGRDVMFFVGSIARYPASFGVLGVFWPPAVAELPLF